MLWYVPQRAVAFHQIIVRVILDGPEKNVKFQFVLENMEIHLVEDLHMVLAFHQIIVRVLQVHGQVWSVTFQFAFLIVMEMVIVPHQIIVHVILDGMDQNVKFQFVLGIVMVEVNVFLQIIVHVVILVDGPLLIVLNQYVSRKVEVWHVVDH